MAPHHVAGGLRPRSVMPPRAIIVALPAAGLIAAMVVPKNFYTPVVKQIVEWFEYALLLAIWPLAFWLMDVFAAIRYR